MTHDLLIKNGMVVDGTGKNRFRGDVAVKAGRIVQIGRVDGAAAKVIDAEGQIVCPGFVDPHTHYDAQITWDQALSMSAEHGVTTVTMGNCGVGIAPCKPAARELLIDDLVTVEGIDKEVLTQGIEWSWETFPEYINAAEKRGTALNLAFLAPIAPLRTYVIGNEANERAATPDETKVMARLLREAMDAGAWGFSTTANRQHIGHGGKPLAARLASREELTAFGAVLKQLNRGVIELALTKAYATLADDEYELLDFMLSASGRPVTWLSLHNLVEKPNAIAEILDRIAPLLARGAKPQILTRPLLYDMNLRRPFQFTEMIAAKPLFDAPALLSTTRFWPSSGLTRAAYLRPMMSVAPPGAYGMIRRIARSGYLLCAWTCGADAVSANSAGVASARRIMPRHFIILLTRFSLGIQCQISCRRATPFGAQRRIRGRTMRRFWPRR